jgi:hypothetical protein
MEVAVHIAMKMHHQSIVTPILTVEVAMTETIVVNIIAIIVILPLIVSLHVAYVYMDFARHQAVINIVR